jgi:hypothetical protein
MSLLYNRVVTLVVGPPGQFGKQITNLRMNFKVEKTSEANPNTGSIEVYNISRQTLAIIEKKGSAMVIKAGYENNPVLVFSGDIAKVTTDKKGADLVTKIECGDGEASYQNADFSQSFAPGTTVNKVLNDVVGSFKATAGDILGGDTSVFQNGLTLCGSSRDHMDEICKKQNLEWSIQDGAVQVLPKGGSSRKPAVLLNSDTGLIGTPTRIKILRATTDPLLGEGNQDAGVKFKSLMNPLLKPGQLVKLASFNVNGVFTVRKVTHAGDTYGNTWESEVEGI